MAPHDASHAPETLLASVLASSLDGIMAFRTLRAADGAIVDFEWLLVNPRAEQIIGRPSAEMIGRRLLVEMPGNRDAGLFDLYVDVVESGHPAHHTFHYDAEGVRAWFQITAVPLGDGFAVTFRDITAQKEAEEMRRAREAAEEAITLRDQFLNTASHELKTPLTALLGHTQLLARRLGRAGTLDERDARTMEHIVQQSQRLNRLVATMLDVARLQNGKLPLTTAPCSLQDVVARAVGELQTVLTEHPLELLLADEPLLVSGDEQRLCEALSNLLLNAARYSPADAPIRVELLRAGDSARLAVSDKGMGIPASALPHVFSRFYRAPNIDANNGVSGMGVGLYLAWEIVTRHGGQLLVASEEGRGSVFTIELPLQ
jgi:PAS domain S-box-containing protein